MNSHRQNLRQLLCALAAMAFGMALAWSQLALTLGSEVSADAIAKVGSAQISQADFQRAVAATESARRTALNAEQREAVLDKLISEQLLLEYGENLGLVRSDPVVRKPLVQAVLGMVRANVATPTEQEARAWYADNLAQFTPPPLYRLRVYQAKNAKIIEKIAELLRANSALPAELGRYRLGYLPDTLLPRTKLQDYLGRDGWQAIESRRAPAVLGPLDLFGKPAVIELLNSQPAKAPPFERIQQQVTNALIRQRGEQALAALTAELRRDYGVTINRRSLND